jgi:N6-L-threonylcarbamoyladenine synthase
MIILAIETSCDETGITLIKTDKKMQKATVLSDLILSQIDIHKEYGGVFPALAKREHAKAIIPLLEKALKEAGLYKEVKKEKIINTKTVKKVTTILGREEEVKENLLTLLSKTSIPKIDAIAVTSGPGLTPALWVGINTALALGFVWDVPVYPINHMEGHIIAGVAKKNEKGVYSLPEYSFPAAALLISGGHTEIVLARPGLRYKIVGETRDDAVGEAFDKVARMMGLSYPGGPKISALAEGARKKGVEIAKDKMLPRPMLHSDDLDFSFSGLKTSVLYKLKEYGDVIDKETQEKVSLDFENSVTEVLLKKIEKTIEKHKIKTLVVGGGVSANKHIQKEFEKNFGERLSLFIPDKNLSTDNGLMIALTAMVAIAHGRKPKKKIEAEGNMRL